MCGRFISFSDSEERDIYELIREISRQMEETDDPYLKLSGEIFPTETVPVLTGGGGALTASFMKWGFPGYADKNKPGAKPRPLINAKSETAQSLSTWRESVETRRCIVPSGGFFEWSHTGVKTKYRFNRPGSRSLFMAGIWRIPPFDKEKQPVFSILTREANESMSDIHNRMPVILDRAEFDGWLAGDWRALLAAPGKVLEKVPA